MLLFLGNHVGHYIYFVFNILAQVLTHARNWIHNPRVSDYRVPGGITESTRTSYFWGERTFTVCASPRTVAIISMANFPNTLLRWKSLCAFLNLMFCQWLCPAILVNTFGVQCLVSKIFGRAFLARKKERAAGFLANEAAILDSLFSSQTFVVLFAGTFSILNCTYKLRLDQVKVAGETIKNVVNLFHLKVYKHWKTLRLPHRSPRPGKIPPTSAWPGYQADIRQTTVDT